MQKQREGVVPFFREVDDDDDDDDDTSRRSGFVGVGDSRRGERENHHHHRGSIYEGTTTTTTTTTTGEENNVGEDPNVHQFKKGTDEHVEVLTAENLRSLPPGVNTCWSRFTRLGMATEVVFEAISLNWDVA